MATCSLKKGVRNTNQQTRLWRHVVDQHIVIFVVNCEVRAEVPSPWYLTEYVSDGYEYGTGDVQDGTSREATRLLDLSWLERTRRP